MAGKAPRVFVLLLVVGMLLTGTVNTLTMKIQFTLYATGKDGEVEMFQKPWFGSLNMLAAMLFVGICDKVVRLCSRQERSASPLLLSDENSPVSTSKTGTISYQKKVCLVAVPAAFDLLATALCCIGIMYIPASAWQMLRGSAVVFACMFSVCFLKMKMYAFKVVGILLVVLGVSLVGLAGMFSSKAAQQSEDPQSKEPASMVVFGMALVLGGQVVQAAQIIAEEFLMKEVDLPPMSIIGYEGFWGTIIMFCVVYPLLWIIPGQDHGHLEDVVDTFSCLASSGHVRAMVSLYLLSCATFNATGIAVTQHLSGVHRMMMDCSRTIFIWAFGLAVHVYNPDSPFGETWTVWSWLQMAGFVILAIGQAAYGEVLRIPGLQYPKKGDAAVKFASPAAALHLASPGGA